jgi:PAS domain S-box-containing protein
MPKAIRGLIPQLSNRDSVRLIYASSDIINAYSIVKDINNQPAFMLGASFPRNITQKGMKAYEIGIMFILGAGLLIFISISGMLGAYVLKPIAKLTEKAVAIGVSTKNLDGFETDRGDEIGVLSREFDAMLERLSKSEERYRIVAENARDVIWVFDLNLGYTFTSPSVKYLRGYTVEEALKQRLDQILTPESYIKAKEMFDREFSLEMNGKLHSPDWSYTTELEMVRKDGSTVWTEVTINILYNEDGSPKGFMGITRDITQRRQAEEALRKSQESYRFITDNMRDTIWLMDMNLRTFWISPSVIRNRGFTLEEIVNMPIENNLTPESMQRVTQILTEYFIPEKLNDKDHEIVLSGELEFLRKDGSTLWSDVVMTLLRDADGKPSTLLCVGRDITDRRKAEEEKKRLEDHLVRVQKMEAIGTLAGGIAHDFNNLLMGILGNISIMRMNFDDSHPFFDRLTSMEEYVHRGSDLTKQLLGFARGGKYEIKPTDLGEFLRRSSEMFGQTKKEIRIHYKVPEAIWSVEVDRGQMDQALLNIYVNAWQAMPRGGDLYLSIENVDLDKMEVRPFDVKPGKYVKMTITDTGVGMDETTKAHIFEPFFTTKERGRGTGLGLASVYGIIKNHGGFINVESEKHLGTSFMIFLPASEKNVEDENMVNEDVQKGHETVLFIDDEDMVLRVGSEMIKGLGYDVMTATGGKQGLEIYEQNQDKIELVILDMIMPDFSGKDTFEILQSINPAVRVLLSSGYSLDGQAKEIMENGCRGFMQKPFTMSELSNKIRGILDEQLNV